MSEGSIILASQSKARIRMLERVGLIFKSIPANLDEEFLLQDMGDISVEEKAEKLAQKKALSIAKNHLDALVIGSDQILEFEGKIFMKSKTQNEARKKLKQLRGNTHRLVTAVSVVQAEQILWTHTDIPEMTMHNFDDKFLDAYCKSAGHALTQCAGGFALEEHGAFLFEKVEGDVFTVMGLPLLPLLNYLRTQHGILP